jgi:hypothetical protein
MGEVYRADDLTLDQPVALQFLPQGVAAEDSRLARFTTSCASRAKCLTRTSAGCTTYVLLRLALRRASFAVAAAVVLLSLSHWTATMSNPTLAIVLALTFFGFYASRAGQPLFGDFGADPKP